MTATGAPAVLRQVSLRTTSNFMAESGGDGTAPALVAGYPVAGGGLGGLVGCRRRP